MKSIRISTAFFITLLAIVLASFGVVKLAHASAPFDDTFNTYSTGDLAGQGSWTSSGNYEVVTTGCLSGNCIKNTAQNSPYNVEKQGSQIATGGVYLYVKVDSTWGASAEESIRFYRTGGGGYAYGLQIQHDTSGWKLHEGFVLGADLANNLSYDTWHQIFVTWDFAGGNCDINVDVDTNGQTSVMNSSGCGITAIEGLQFSSSGSGSVGKLMIDEIGSLEFSAPITNTTTRFESFIPAGDSTVSTSTNFTFGATGFINPDEMASDTVLYIRYRQQTGMGLRGNSSLSTGGEITLNATTSGAFNLSTTTEILNSGVYQAYAAIQYPKFNLFGFKFWNTVLISQTWIFTVATSSATELQSVIMLLGTSGLGSGQASSTQLIGNLGACQNFLTGSTTDCLISLVVPSSDQLIGAGQTLSNSLATNMPFSFFWTIYTKINTITGSTTPAQGTDIAIHGLLGAGTTTMFAWSSAKTTLDTVIPENTSKYLVWSEWILFSGYALLRIISIL